MTIGAGGADAITTGLGNDTVTATGSITSLDTGEGDDDVTVSGYAVSIRTREGADSVATGGNFVESIHTGADNDSVTVGTGGVAGRWRRCRYAGLFQLYRRHHLFAGRRRALAEHRRR